MQTILVYQLENQKNESRELGILQASKCPDVNVISDWLDVYFGYCFNKHIIAIYEIELLFHSEAKVRVMFLWCFCDYSLYCHDRLNCIKEKMNSSLLSLCILPWAKPQGHSNDTHFWASPNWLAAKNQIPQSPNNHLIRAQ